MIKETILFPFLLYKMGNDIYLLVFERLLFALV